MNFKYVDIGTSDFETRLSLKAPEDNILLVEPLFYYLSNLPSGPGVFKANFAISDTCSYGKIYYVKDELIRKHGMPWGVRGCNSLGGEHPTVVEILKNMNLPLSLISVEEIRVISFGQLVDIYGVTSIDSLKVDTEGHDHIILGDVLSLASKGFFIREIIFEYIESFGNTDKLDFLIKGFEELGFNDKCKVSDRWGIDNNYIVRRN
jgi:hypothetical protein